MAKTPGVPEGGWSRSMGWMATRDGFEKQRCAHARLDTAKVRTASSDYG